jgi:hypothetical protein
MLLDAGPMGTWPGACCAFGGVVIAVASSSSTQSAQPYDKKAVKVFKF